MREQCVVLRDVADATILRAHPDPARRVEPHLITERDPAGIGTSQTRDQTQQGRLAGTRRADHRHGLGADAQRGAEIEGAARVGDVDVQAVHERRISFEASRMPALTTTSSTPIATA